MTDRPIYLAQVSDLHLDPDRAADRARFDHVAAALADRQVDLIVNTGDISDDGLHRAQMFPTLRRWLDELPAPVLTVPGNHDVGNKYGEHDPAVTEAFLGQWLDCFEDDRFVADVGNWRLVGIDTMVLGSDFRREREQRDWLDGALAGADGRPIAMFGHMPLFLQQPDERVTGGSAYWIPPAEARDGILERIAAHHVRLYASGHVHWYANRRAMGLEFVWAPSLQGLIVDDHLYPRGGEVSGFVMHTLHDDRIEHELVELDIPAKTIKLNYPDD